MNIPGGTGAAGAVLAAPGALTDRVRALMSYAGTTTLSYLLAGLTLAWLFHGAVAETVLWGWAAVFALVVIGRALVALAYGRALPGDDLASLQWLRRWNLGTLASGALWGVTGWVFYGQGEPLHYMSMVMVIFAFCVGSTPMLGWQRTIFLAYVGLSLAPTIARIVMHGGPGSMGLIVASVLIAAMTIRLGRNYRDTFGELVELKSKAQDLAVQLRAESQAADAARREAELANRAKTQFFAAASHDLRQPLHALGLFAEALRQKSRDDETTHLINSINSSVDALDGLFGELLDITKIDTGGVEPRPTDFPLDELFRKLRLHFEPIAFEKGLALRFRGGRRYVYADPLLVERILRNLTSNAIRYTEDGTVLVSARSRGGRLLLQVWDSGVGIPEADRERVFDEFVQLPGARTVPDPHQRKGLGLGLAIVRRLANLMNAPLALRSTPGRGSVFTIELPLGKPPSTVQTPSLSSLPIGLTLDKRLVVMIEDDPAVKSGLEVLLKSWGASVIAFDTLAACRTWAQAAEPSMLQPDLIIADYRLETGHTGVEAIRALRGMLDRPIPAIVVTGSVLSNHEREAHEHDFHLLLKPVVPNKLRAMIAFKLGVR